MAAVKNSRTVVQGNRYIWDSGAKAQCHKGEDMEALEQTLILSDEQKHLAQYLI